MKASILLVEDEVDARESLARSFERAGFDCAAVGTKEEALARARAVELLDLVVTDVVLGKNESAGLELLDELREAHVSSPVIVITAFADVQKVKRALNAGAAYLLEKPFRAKELLDVVARVLGATAEVGHQVERTLLRHGLTDKERAIARHLLKGLASAEIAVIEGNSEKTIRQHISQVYAKCGVSSRGEFFHFILPF